MAPAPLTTPASSSPTQTSVSSASSASLKPPPSALTPSLPSRLPFSSTPPPAAPSTKSSIPQSTTTKFGPNKRKKSDNGMLWSRSKKSFNLRTYKNHSLGDYVKMIRTYGTTDSYSTEPVSTALLCMQFFFLPENQTELEHRTPKSRYIRTSRKFFEKQLSQIERRQTRIRRIRQKIDGIRSIRLQPDKRPDSSAIKYHIGKSQNNPIILGSFLRENRSDPALQVVAFVSLFFRRSDHISRTLSKS